MKPADEQKATIEAFSGGKNFKTGKPPTLTKNRLQFRS